MATHKGDVIHYFSWILRKVEPQSPLETLAPGCSAETAAATLREAAPKVAKYVHQWTLRTEQTLLEMAQLPITDEDTGEAVREAKNR